MKTADPRHHTASAANGTPGCPPVVPAPRGEGAAKNAKTNKPQKTGIIAGRKRGGQPGNRNAAKPVTVLSQVRDLHRRIRAALRAADAQVKKRRALSESGAPVRRSGDT